MPEIEIIPYETLEMQECVSVAASLKSFGEDGKFYTFPYFLTFLLKRYLKDRISSNEK